VIALTGIATPGYSAPPRIEKGAVVVTLSNGAVRRLETGSAAFDLWTSPDNSLIAFATADSHLRTTVDDPDPLYKSSSIYVAAEDRDYAPVLLLRGPLKIGSLKLERFNSPRFGPGRKTIYVKGGYTMTTDVILAIDIDSRKVRFVGYATDFRVIWGGQYSGELIFMIRHLPYNGSEGISYECRVGASPEKSRLVKANCVDFLGFTREWAGKNGAMDR